MAKISLRRLVSELTALALSTSAIGAADAATTSARPASARLVDDDAELEAELDRDDEIDRGGLDPHDAAAALGRGLALALGELRPLMATQVAATWSTSRDPVRRLALAHALEWTFPLVGDALVLDHLARDDDPAIRAATARAAWIRRRSGGDDVLRRLADDPDPQVQAIARAAH